MTTPTDAELEAWLALADAATPGPWEVVQSKVGIDRGIRAQGGLIGEFYRNGGHVYEEISPVADNVAFIAAARTGWPRTIKALQEAEEANQTAYDAMDAHQKYTQGQRQKLEVEIQRLRTALIAHWHHQTHCPVAIEGRSHFTSERSIAECTCGLKEAIPMTIYS